MDMVIAETEITMEKVKWEDLKKACEYLEANPSLYYNYAPLNLLDTVKQGAYKYKTADCWNYIKSLLWSNCAQKRRQGLGDHRGPGGPGHAPGEAGHEQQIQDRKSVV